MPKYMYEIACTGLVIIELRREMVIQTGKEQMNTLSSLKVPTHTSSYPWNRHFTHLIKRVHKHISLSR